MSTYRIEAGTLTAFYEAETESAAILAYVQDAGYSSVKEAAEVCGQTEQQFVGDLAITKS
jgi:hypothetical protein